MLREIELSPSHLLSFCPSNEHHLFGVVSRARSLSFPCVCWFSSSSLTQVRLGLWAFPMNYVASAFKKPTNTCERACVQPSLLMPHKLLLFHTTLLQRYMVCSSKDLLHTQRQIDISSLLTFTQKVVNSHGLRILFPREMEKSEEVGGEKGEFTRG